VASRAETLVAPASRPAASTTLAVPSLRAAVREALSDLYYHSWRLVPANLVWAVTAVVAVVIAIFVPLGILALAVVALPTAGLFRMSTRIARGRAVSFRDALDAWRRDGVPSLLLGGGLVAVAVLLGANVWTGLVAATALGWAFATLALWGLVAAWLLAWTAWPVLTDPARERWPARERVHLAGLLVLAHPVRLGGLGIGLLVFLIASLIATVALVTVSAAVAAVVAARFVLPAADRLDARLAFAATRGLETDRDDDVSAEEPRPV
jgi:hypothetical protein